jgi:hypothetical protein
VISAALSSAAVQSKGINAHAAQPAALGKDGSSRERYVHFLAVARQYVSEDNTSGFATS